VTLPFGLILPPKADHHAPRLDPHWRHCRFARASATFYAGFGSGAEVEEWTTNYTPCSCGARCGPEPFQIELLLPNILIDPLSFLGQLFRRLRLAFFGRCGGRLSKRELSGPRSLW